MATFSLRFIIDAEQDLDEIDAFLTDNDSLDAADAVLDKISAACASLAEMPHRGRYTPEMLLTGVQTYREIHSGPYRIIYEVRGETVYVHAVLDSRRDLGDLLLARLVR